MFSNSMRALILVVLLVAVAGCSGLGDKRLLGTWRSNGEQTIANLLQQDPRWTNAPPAKMQQFKSVFGQMTITYGSGTIIARYGGKEQSLGYEVVERGPDYVVIQIKGGVEDGQKERLRFVDGSHGYWIQSFMAPEIEERFDKVSP
jgi:hypothetical protein